MLHLLVLAATVAGPLSDCLLLGNEVPVGVVAVAQKGTPNEHAVSYQPNGTMYFAEPADEYSPHQVAFSDLVGRSAYDLLRWPVEPHCEFTYVADHFVHVYVYKIDAELDMGAHPNWFSQLQVEKNGLAALAEKIAKYEAEHNKRVKIKWIKRGLMAFPRTPDHREGETESQTSAEGGPIGDGARMETDAHDHRGGSGKSQ